MSTDNPTAGKKKMAGTAAQFEDADETDDLFAGNNNDETKSEGTSDATPDDKEQTDDTKAKVSTESPDTTMKKDDNNADKEDKEDKDKKMKEEDKGGLKSEEPPTGTSGEKTEQKDSSTPEKEKRDLTTPVPMEEDKKKEPSTGSPLEALASMACATSNAGKNKSKKQRASSPKASTTKKASEKAANKEKDKETTTLLPMEGTRVKAEDISCTDVLCGRGGQSNHHPGNIFFRRLVRAKQEEYLKANKREKTVVAKDIVKLIRMLSPGGRFLKKDAKDENIYVDVGDTQARNKASQALREGAPELREELRDQHNRLNAERGGGPEVRLPYHGSGRSSSSAAAAASSDDKADGDGPAAARNAQAAAAAAHGMFLPAFAAADARAAAALRARSDGKNDPPDVAEGEDGTDASRSAATAAAVQVAAEERARRMVLASMGQPGLGAAHLLNPHLGLGGLGMNPFLAQHTSAAQLQAAAALQAAGGSHLLSPQALMMAAAAQQPPSSAAALLHASRARDLASQIDAANFAAATAAGFNPLILQEQQRAAAAAPLFQDSMRLHEIVNSAGNANANGGSNSSNSKNKRERDETDRDPEENHTTKAARLSRQYL